MWLLPALEPEALTREKASAAVALMPPHTTMTMQGDIFPFKRCFARQSFSFYCEII